MKLKFSVLGEPQGKGRPRFANIKGKAITRTPQETVIYENLIVTEYRRQVGNRRFEDNAPLSIEIRAFFAIPQSASKKKQKLMESGELRPLKKSDADNILKVVCDALNQVAYRDDVQIVDARVVKYYGREPKIIVCVSEVDGGGEQHG